MTSRYVATNKASSTVAGNFNSTATSFTVATGEGARFPSPTGGDFTLIVLQNAGGQREIVCCVGRSADTFTVGVPGSAAANVLGRNYETIYGMAAASWIIGDVVSCRPTAGLMEGDYVIPVGTPMLFMQTAAPVGWTKSTSHNDKALRVVSGTVSSGGTVDFSAAFASKTVTGTTDGTALTEAQLAAHTHTGTTGTESATHTHAVTDPGHTHLQQTVYQTATYFGSGGYSYAPNGSNGLATGASVTGISLGTESANHTHAFTSAATGSGDAHTHGFTGTAIDMAVKYVDAIICTRD